MVSSAHDGEDSDLTDDQLVERDILNIKPMQDKRTMTEVLGEYDDDSNYSGRRGDDDIDDDENSGPTDNELIGNWTNKLEEAGLYRSEFADHAAEFKTGKYVPTAALNYNVEWASDTAYVEEELGNFVSPLAEENYTPDSQVRKSCFVL